MTLTGKLTAALVFVLFMGASWWYAYNAGNRNGANGVLVGTLKASNAALLKRVEENEALADKQAADAKKASEDHEAELEIIRKSRLATTGQRVQFSADLCRGVTGTTEAAAPGSDGQATTTTGVLPVEFTDSLQNAAEEADTIVADLRHLKRRVDEAGCF